MRGSGRAIGVVLPAQRDMWRKPLVQRKAPHRASVQPVSPPSAPPPMASRHTASTIKAAGRGRQGGCGRRGVACEPTASPKNTRGTHAETHRKKPRLQKGRRSSDEGVDMRARGGRGGGGGGNGGPGAGLRQKTNRVVCKKKLERSKSRQTPAVQLRPLDLPPFWHSKFLFFFFLRPFLRLHPVTPPVSSTLYLASPTPAPLVPRRPPPPPQMPTTFLITGCSAGGIGHALALVRCVELRARANGGGGGAAVGERSVKPQRRPFPPFFLRPLPACPTCTSLPRHAPCPK